MANLNVILGSAPAFASALSNAFRSPSRTNVQKCVQTGYLMFSPLVQNMPELSELLKTADRIYDVLEEKK